MSNLSPDAQEKSSGLIAAHVARGVPVGGYLDGGIEPTVPEGSLSPGPRPISRPVQGARLMPYGHKPIFSPDGPTSTPVSAAEALRHPDAPHRQPAFGANGTPPEDARFASEGMVGRGGLGDGVPMAP